MTIKLWVLRPLFGLVIFGVLFGGLELMFGVRKAWVWFRRGFGTDVMYLFLSPLVRSFSRVALLVPALVLIGAEVTSVGELRSGLYAGFGPVGVQPKWLQGVEVMLLADLLGYWVHRWFHRAWQWRFHAVHHSSETLDWLASVRVHPFNELMNRLVQATPILLLGFDPRVAILSAPLLTLYAVGLHADVDWDFGPLRGVFASPVFHRWHHSSEPEALDKNFAGLFPVWDILFGTYYMPEGVRPRSFGTLEPVPEGIFSQLAYPLRGGVGSGAARPCGGVSEAAGWGMSGERAGVGSENGGLKNADNR